MPAPESWLEWVGWRKLVFGPGANRHWHYTRGEQPVRHVRWFIRSVTAPKPETAINLWRSLVAFVTRTEPPWIIEAREAAAVDEALNEGRDARISTGSAPRARRSSRTMRAASAVGSAKEARSLTTYKRCVMATGLVGTYIVWAIFVWCELPLRACATGAGADSCRALRSVSRFIFTCACACARVAIAATVGAFV